MKGRRVGEALKGARGRFRPRVEFVPASRLPGATLTRLGGGEQVPTPCVPELPTTDSARAGGLCGSSLALPPATVRTLSEVQLCVGENVVRTRSGSVVVDAVSPDRYSGLRRRHNGAPMIEVEGTAALHGVPVPGVFESLVEALPAALLLQHPALHRMAPVTVLSLGASDLVEGFLLERIENRQVVMATVAAGSVLEPTRTLFPSPVTRQGAGAIPLWYRRWIDAQTAAVTSPPAARRILITHGPDDPLLRHPRLLEVASAAGLATIDTLTGALGGTGTMDADTLVATLRDATLVVGASDDALGHAVVCRRTEILQVGVADTVSPRVAQLASARALPYGFLRPEDLGARLAAG